MSLLFIFSFSKTPHNSHAYFFFLLVTLIEIKSLYYFDLHTGEKKWNAYKEIFPIILFISIRLFLMIDYERA